MRRYYQIICVLILTSIANAQDNCSSVSKIVDVESKVAYAGAMSNIFSSEGSLNYESKRMLFSAVDNYEKIQPKEEFCPSGCKLDPKPEIIFSSIPNKTLSSYDEKDRCEKLFTNTKSNPIKYANKEFQKVDTFYAWFSRLCQGRGDDGSDLYSKCDGDCSPQYRSHLVKNENKLEVSTEVVCGHARDKDDDKFKLTVSYRFTCKS